MKHSYIIIDDNHESILKTQANAMHFENLAFSGYANTYDDALNLILEHQPSLVFMEINPEKKESNLSLALINELYRYLTKIPKIIVTTNTQEMIFKAMEYGVADYLIKPLNISDLRKSILKFEKSVTTVSNPAVSNHNVVSVSQNIVPEIILANEPQIENISSDTIIEETIPEISEEIQEITEKEEVPLEITVEEDISVENFVSNDEADLEENVVVEKATEEIQEEIATEETAENENIIESAIEIPEIINNSAEIVVETEEEATSETTKDEDSEEPEENSEDDVTLLDGKKIILQQEQPLIICVKSYGDYRYIDSRDILYFEADNNSTDIHLKDGEMITAFKTLKHFENVLPKKDFLRIHNSYIINVNQVARIHTGNALCFIKNSTAKLPFSKSYKENVELIIHRIASGNYLEI